MEISNLLMDIVADILSRLPIKTLLQCRCVLKSWCTLIDSSNFIKMHLNKSIETNSNLSLIIKNEDLYSVNFDLLDKAVMLDHPSRNPRMTNILGSCDGLLLLGNTEMGIAIWNPSTRKYRKLPDSPIPTPNYPKYFRYIKCGFGYDKVGEDYKVIRIAQFYCEEYDCSSSEAVVYSLKLNSWRRIQDFPYYLCPELGGHGVLAGGALHWVVKERRDPLLPKILVAFDIGVEEYRVVPEPEYVDKGFRLDVEILGGCLCVTCSYFKDRLDIWVMKEYGVKESWTKLLSVEPPNIRPFEYMKPLAYSKSGGEILLNYDDKRLVWYDLKEKLIEEVRVLGMPYSFSAGIFVGSLVPLDGQNDSRKNGQERRKDMKNKKKRDKFLSEGFKLVL